MKFCFSGRWVSLRYCRFSVCDELLMSEQLNCDRFCLPHFKKFSFDLEHSILAQNLI